VEDVPLSDGKNVSTTNTKVSVRVIFMRFGNIVIWNVSCCAGKHVYLYCVIQAICGNRYPVLPFTELIRLSEEGVAALHVEEESRHTFEI